jgi:hypothetical protein
MTALDIDSHFAEDSASSDDRDLSAIEAMFEQFLTPNWEEYLAMSVSADRVKSPARHCCVDPLHPEPIGEELLKMTIDLALATLEAAETALFAKFDVAGIERSIAD